MNVTKIEKVNKKWGYSHLGINESKQKKKML